MCDKKELLLFLNNIKDNTDNLFNALTDNVNHWTVCEDAMHCPIVYSVRLAVKHLECFMIPKLSQIILYFKENDVYDVPYLIKSLKLIQEWNSYVCNLLKTNVTDYCKTNKCYVTRNTFPLLYTFADQNLCFIYATGLDVILNKEIEAVIELLEENNA